MTILIAMLENMPQWFGQKGQTNIHKLLSAKPETYHSWAHKYIWIQLEKHSPPFYVTVEANCRLQLCTLIHIILRVALKAFH